MPASLSFEQKLFWLCLLCALPAAIAVLVLLWVHDYSYYLQGLVALFLVLQIGVLAYQVKANTSHQFRTLSNLLEALSRGDYTLRGRRVQHQDALAELVNEINKLADLLTQQRFEVKETQLLLGKVISHIDVAVFTFDRYHKIKLVNPAGAKLLDKNAFELSGQHADSLGLAALFACHNQVCELEFGGTRGRFHIATDRFIEDNQTHLLLFITNVQALLRTEERKAWQNLIRVISHEINNSLTPIVSLSQTLQQLTAADSANAKDMREGLALIRQRAQDLGQFIQSYQTLAKLPSPNKRRINVQQQLSALPALFPQLSITLHGDDMTLKADASQLQQLLINLCKNAAEAGANALSIKWQAAGQQVFITMADNGPGLVDTENLFTPFFTTKKHGNGIGLVLCRQITEAHGGQLTLSNASNGGCVVECRLPTEDAGDTPT